MLFEGPIFEGPIFEGPIDRSILPIGSILLIDRSTFLLKTPFPNSSILRIYGSREKFMPFMIYCHTC